MRVELASRPRRPYCSDLNFSSDTGGTFFAEVLHLASGRFAARAQIMFSEFAAGEVVRITARNVATSQILAEVVLTADLARRVEGDEIYLSFSMPQPGHVEIAGHVTANRDSTLLRLLTVLDEPNGKRARSDFFFPDTEPASIAELKEVSIGTTGICNASCVHCPTNKKSFHMPHGRMSESLFEKIIIGLHDGGFKGEIFFGLFAEPLEDPLLLDRTKLIKKLLPESPVSIATNGALFDPIKHADIFDFVDHIAVHVEAIDPAVYNYLMHPLKAERVLPKIRSMIGTAKQKNRDVLSITTPVHKGNIAEVRAISVFCHEFGLHSNFTALSSRAWEGGIYPKLAIAPTGGLCRPTTMVTSMFIDFDGLVLPCCYDFSRSLPLGNLTHQTFDEVFASPEWDAMYGVFKRGEWSTREACGRCRADDASTIVKLAQSLSASVFGNFTSFPASLFRVTPIARRDGGGSIFVDPDKPDGAAIYGPYANLQAGKYRLYHELDIQRAGSSCAIELDVAINFGKQIAVKKVVCGRNSQEEPLIDFTIDSAATVEFRIFKIGTLGFEYKGATLVRL
jgi:MoaA/NifB/PqqE/SkfB family radical SAM enzyme